MPRPGPIPVFLSEDDLRLLQTVIDEQRKMVRNTQNRPKYATDEQEQQGPEVYVGKVLETIPGIELSGGEVDVYKEIGGELVRAELTVSAFNLLGKDLRDDTWILALRDKFGTYFIIAAFDTEIKTLVNFLLSVCPTKSGVNVTSLSEMKQPVLIPLSWLQGEPICVTDPQDCCNPGTGTGTGTAHGPVVNCCLGVATDQHGRVRYSVRLMKTQAKDVEMAISGPCSVAMTDGDYSTFTCQAFHGSVMVAV
jgi:hypothetical protein